PAGAVAWAKRVDEEQRLTHIWSAYGQLRQFRSGVLKIAPPSETQRVFEELSRHDPRDAISRLKELGNLHLERDAVRGVARSWTNDDPTAAWEWANDLDVPELRRTASREVIAEVGKSSP